MKTITKLFVALFVCLAIFVNTVPVSAELIEEEVTKEVTRIGEPVFEPCDEVPKEVTPVEKFVPLNNNVSVYDVIPLNNTVSVNNVVPEPESVKGVYVEASNNISGTVTSLGSEVTDDLIYYWPTDDLYITSSFGYRKGFSTPHKGIDIRTGYGTAIYASAEGDVIEANYNSTAGYHVVISHRDGRKTRYLHMAKNLQVKKGAHVKAGTLLGFSSDSGAAQGPHLHFDITDKNGKTYIDPETILSKIRAKDVVARSGYYMITTSTGNVLAFDDSNNLVVSSKYPITANKIFEVIECGNGEIMFRNIKDSMYIDVMNANADNGTRIWAYSGNGSRAQVFTAKYHDFDKGFSIVSTLSTGTDLVLDISEKKDQPGQPVHLWQYYAGLSNQIFRLTPVPDAQVRAVLNPNSPVITITFNNPCFSIMNNKKYRVKGTVSCTTDRILRVRSYIVDLNGTVLDSTLDDLSKKKCYSMQLYKSNCDKKSDFDKLPRGIYRFVIQVETQNSGFEEYTTSFTVY